MRLQGAQHELVHLREFVQALLHAQVRAGDQLQLRLAVIGGDAGVRQRSAQSQRVRRQSQAPLGQHTQAFFLNATADAHQALCGQAGDAVVQGIHKFTLCFS